MSTSDTHHLNLAQSRIEAEPVAGEPVVRGREPDPCTLVIFGATGDLTSRKLVPALHHLSAAGALPERFRVIGVGRQDLTDEAFRQQLESAAREHVRGEWSGWDDFASRIGYQRGDLAEPSGYRALKERLEGDERDADVQGNRLYYLAIPPRFFPVVLEQLRDAGLLHDPAHGPPWSRVIIEKPFGHDLESARELNAVVGNVLAESQTYRIDHYLGKESVQNLLVFRFGNSVFEPLWNHQHVDHVQVTGAESIDVQGRGQFYDQTGVLRDVVQNHLLQVLALVAMEPPISFEADDIRDQKVQLLRALRPIEGRDVAKNVVTAQYEGYLQEEGVEEGSRTPTYTAMRLHVDNWRWRGVPFYLRAGKGLSSRLTEVSIHFREVPLCLFGHDSACQTVQPNVLHLRLQPDEGISLRFVSKVPGEDLSVANVHMNMSYGDTFKTRLADAYERLLLDAMRGDQTLFTRRDGVEHAWRLITPILERQEKDGGRLPAYAKDSTGPAEADELIESSGRWWLPLD